VVLRKLFCLKDILLILAHAIDVWHTGRKLRGFEGVLLIRARFEEID
jgi:hypothetical protein